VSVLWTIIIGFIAGVIAKFIMPGDNEPAGFILTAILGIVGAFVATFLGQALGWYRPGEGAGLIGAVVGAIIILLVYGIIAASAAITQDAPRELGSRLYRHHNNSLSASNRRGLSRRWRRVWP
jgi:uncharacterized membrane protein YeaQ/YmgE (transglycosylase-associated protein family)